MREKSYIQKKIVPRIDNRPFLFEIINFFAGLTPEQIESTLDEFKESPACIEMFLKKYDECFMGVIPRKNFVNWSEKLKGVQFGFMCYVSGDDNIKVLGTWELGL